MDLSGKPLYESQTECDPIENYQSRSFKHGDLLALSRHLDSDTERRTAVEAVEYGFESHSTHLKNYLEIENGYQSERIQRLYVVKA